MNHTAIRRNGSTAISHNILKTILQEIRLLRSEMSLLLPSEDIKEYSHPDRIKRSYLKAIKQYRPVSL